MGVEPQAGDLSGGAVGPWRLLRRLGEDALGAVYEVEDAAAGRRAAMKVLHRHLSVDANVKRRFVEQASAAARAHESTVQGFDSGTTSDGLCWVVLVLLRGDHASDMPEIVRLLQTMPHGPRVAPGAAPLGSEASLAAPLEIMAPSLAAAQRPSRAPIAIAATALLILLGVGAVWFARGKPADVPVPVSVPVPAPGSLECVQCYSDKCPTFAAWYPKCGSPTANPRFAPAPADVCPTGRPFALALDLPTQVAEGAPVEVKLRSPCDAHLVVCAIGGDGSGAVLWPNDRSAPTLVGGQQTALPTPAERAGGMSLEARLRRPGEPAYELFVAYALRDQADFDRLRPSPGSPSSGAVFAADLEQKLAALPADRWSRAAASYVITPKK
jgi:hypothetical protein